MIELKAILPQDESLVLSWLDNPEICKYTSHAVFPASRQEVNNKILRLGIYGRYGLIGVISLQRIDWVNRSAELAILVGGKQPESKGIGKQACALMCHHGFDMLNLHRIYLGTHQDNIGMQKVAESLGMKLEGRTRQAFYKHGQYADILHYGLLKEEFMK